MSVAPSRNPLPPRVWRAIRSLLRAYGIEIQPVQYVFVDDDVQDEHTAFAMLYVKGEVP